MHSSESHLKLYALLATIFHASFSYGKNPRQQRPIVEEDICESHILITSLHRWHTGQNRMYIIVPFRALLGFPAEGPVSTSDGTGRLAII